MTTWTCPVHEGQVKFVPPGFSQKTGKAYTGFFCCPVKGCEQRPPKAGAPPVAAAAPQRPAATPQPKRIVLADDVEGKCRTLAICAWLQSHDDLQAFWEIEKDILAYMMHGKTPFDEQWGPVDGSPFPEA